ncbi:collectin-10 [Latimeria chalumnae]|uniref:Collectin subfamily member 10 n=1 Tax=Latimeria chalumnae TaxID=7897 RepID=M3XJ46_LATCH|nr:PREDICTED: collectin-10 [Latimeria chalumnae]|eukprot:XP_005994607.1 PREDICTED: collectin-10 [Latimeria chalumnae]
MNVQLLKNCLFALLLLQIQTLCLKANSQPGTEVCSTHMILPGPKGDQGENGNEGEVGKPGKVGPVGLKGMKGEPGNKGGMGKIGKIGTIGVTGDKGNKGLVGPPGMKGKTGSSCDCGRYRKVVGQLDVNISRLKTSMKFVKNVIAGVKETEEKFYLIVKEEKNYNDALTQCRNRGGTLAMPKDEETNSLIANYITMAGLSRVFIGLNDAENEGQFMYTDNTPLQNYSSWRDSEPNNAYEGEDCVEMVSTGGWNDVECHLTIYFVCEFRKKK